MLKKAENIGGVRYCQRAPMVVYWILILPVQAMAKTNKMSVVNLLSLLPDEELNRIAEKTKVNYYTKVLDGKSILSLILYSLIECRRNSLRTMEDIFNSDVFKFLFNLDPEKTVRYNSISERLSVINVEFFKQAYELIYTRFSQYYNEQEIEKHKLIRVDSTMVAETANKLAQGMNIGRKKDGKKQVKYTVAFDGHFPCLSELFTDKKFLSEDLTIPKVVSSMAIKDKDAIFAFDRGVQSRSTFCSLSDSHTLFVTRLNANARYIVAEDISKVVPDEKYGSLVLQSDQKIKFKKKGSEKCYENHFRLIIATNPKSDETYYFLTNIFDLGIGEILAFYKKRWDIEVFFRFLKQELNFSHIISTSENGLQVMMYMTLITSMLVLVYKKLNQVGYKTAVRRISFELNEFIIKLVVKNSGGDPSLVFR